MKDGEPCTSRGVSTVLEGVTPRPQTKESMAWRFLPYEYYARNQWLVDSEVVKRIFAMTIEGYGLYQIASKLKSEKVLIPFAYFAQHGEDVNKNKTFKDMYGRGSSTICNILEKREYLGRTINFKTRKHFTDKADMLIKGNNADYGKKLYHVIE